MKKLLWLAVGVAAGFVVAHQANRTPQGREFFARIDDRTREFRTAVADSYRSREAELRAALGKAEDAINDLRK